MFKADIRDAYYHLRLRKVDQLYLSFCVGGVVYVPVYLKYGLAGLLDDHQFLVGELYHSHQVVRGKYCHDVVVLSPRRDSRP
jgi:hypothetical protein